MKLLSQINVERSPQTAVIQLLQGDLSAIPTELATDILVMSAFPGDYIALKGSLIYGHKETEMPLIMGIYSYIDCSEGNPEKIQQCVQQLLK